MSQEIIYFSLPRFLQGTESHAAALAQIQQRHEGATILDPTELWKGKSMQEWKDSFKQTLASVTHYYIVPDLGGIVGAGCYDEWCFFYEQDIPILAFFPAGILPVAGFEVLHGGRDWKRFARVLSFANIQAAESQADDDIPF